jgi:hypothetical protein
LAIGNRLDDGTNRWAYFKPGQSHLLKLSPNEIRPAESADISVRTCKSAGAAKSTCSGKPKMGLKPTFVEKTVGASKTFKNSAQKV